ncbi:chymotrypsin family serine protease [Actinophytocola sp. KF-1]
MRLRRAAAVVAAAVCAVTTAGVAAASPAPTAAPPAAPAGVPAASPAVESRGQAAAALIGELTPPRGSSIVATRWDEAEGAVVVAYTGDAAATTAAVAARVRTTSAAVPVRYRKVRYTARQLSDVANAIMSTRATWGGAGAEDKVVTAIPVPFESRISVRLTERDGAVEAAARRAFDVPLDFGVSARPRALFGRYADTAPWTTGNALWFSSATAGGSLASCTQGYSWRNQGVVYASTAGHCATRLTSVWNGNPSQRIGEVSHRYFTHLGPTDVEFIRITSGSAGDASVWVGGPGTGDQRWVTAADNTTNTYGKVCSSGANGGLACGQMTYRDVPIDFEDPDTGAQWRINGLSCVDVPVGGALARPGDSGGPILSTFTDGTVKAWGQLVGGPVAEDCDFTFTPVLTISAVTGSTMVVR